MKDHTISLSDFIITESPDAIKAFIKSAVSNYFEELEKYIQENDDPDIVRYATERTMASLFVCGNLRKDEKMTAVQEYGTMCSKNNLTVAGRPDIFINHGGAAIWVECKYDRNSKKLGLDHWDIEGWLEWDSENALAQVETYYNSEKHILNNCYNQRYLLTLCFKLIKENKEAHIKKVHDNLQSAASKENGKIWYYQVGFLETHEVEMIGIEVYGTCTKMDYAAL